MSLSVDPRIGSELFGYRLDALLGRGGMGVVYKAYDHRLKRYVALKLIAPELSEDKRFRERFLAESELAASLEHPNVVPIYEAFDAEGRLAIAMRYVEGTDLKQLLETERVLDPERTLAISAQVAAALDAAHARGLVHRDVKPSNVLLDETEHVYLADFGLSRRLTDLGVSGEDGLSVGTPAYVSPEQIERGSVDGRADEYALGCLLYECLTGQAPFRRDSELAVLWAHVQEEPPAASAQAPDLPVGIDPVLARAMAKSPRDRYASCGELVDAARVALGSVQLHQLEVPGLPGKFSPLETARRGLRRRHVLLAAGIAALVALAIAIPLALIGGGSSGTSTLGPTSVGVIDPGTNQLAAQVPLGSKSSLIAAGLGYVWVADPEGSTLTRIDPKTLKVASFGIEGGMPTGIAVGGGSVWVGVNRGHSTAVVEIGPQLGQYRRTIVVEPASGQTVLLAFGAGSLWTLEEGTEEVTRINPATGKKKTLTQGASGSSIAYGHDAVWLGGRIGVTRLDPDTGAPKTLPLSGLQSANSTSIAIGPDAVWFAASTQPMLFSIDTRAAGYSKYSVGSGPSGVAVNSGAVWVANSLDGTVSRVDPRTGPVATVPLGASPGGVVAHYGRVWTSPGQPVR